MAKTHLTTIEDLARMINEGFKTMATKEDIRAFEGRVNTRFDSVESRLDHLDARVGRIEADVHGLRDEMVHKQEFQDALDRIKYIEKKLGIESGV
jgi:tetrahydromethanopterin S-methyltransferase subunit G